VVSSELMVVSSELIFVHQFQLNTDSGFTYLVDVSKQYASEVVENFKTEG
jgi:hypothetical protein